METPIVIDNLEDLKKRLAKTGFGNLFDDQIEHGFASGKTRLEPRATEQLQNDKMEFVLDINSENNKAYFNGFRATIHQEGKDPLSHWFRSEDRITREDAHIMMMDRNNPRAVHKTLYDKENKPYGVWMQINFNKQTPSGNNEMHRFHDKYGYNLLEKLNDYAFAGLETSKQKLAAYNMLEQGREIELTPLNPGRYDKVTVRANPERKSFSFMDNEGTFLSHDQFRTPEALERIQQLRNNKPTTVDFTRNESTDSNEVKKNSVSEPSLPLKKTAKPRVRKGINQKQSKGIRH